MCECGETEVIVTFDQKGVITSVTGDQGTVLSSKLQRCLLDMLAGYCYPSLAGQTQTFMTCHAWIA